MPLLTTLIYSYSPSVACQWRRVQKDIILNIFGLWFWITKWKFRKCLSKKKRVSISWKLNWTTQNSKSVWILFWNTIKYNASHFIKNALLSALSETKKNPDLKQVILLSPSAASFDQYKNFEHRGNTFKQLVKKYSW